MTKDEVTGAGDITALHRQVEKLTGQVRDLKGQRISTNTEIKFQHEWVEAELTERAMAVQVHQAEGRMEALEVGLAAQVEQMQQVEGIRSELASELAAVRKLAAEQDTRICATAVQVVKRMKEHMEGHMAETTWLTELKEVTNIQSGALEELNEDVQRLYNQSFGALVEEGQSPDGGWYTKQEFNRCF